MHKTRCNYYFHGSRTSHHLALKLRNDDQFTDIVSIRSREDEILTDPHQINHEFPSFYNYNYSYSSHISFNKDKCKEFLNSISFTHLSENDAADLGEQLTLAEIGIA